MMETRGRPSAVNSRPPTSSGSPCSQASKPARRQQAVQPHRELEPILLREERVEVERAYPRHRRALDFADNPFNRQIAPRAPRVPQQRRDERVLAALERIGVEADERQQAGRGRADSLAKRVGVVPHGGRRSGERLAESRGRAPPGCAACRWRTRPPPAGARCGPASCPHSARPLVHRAASAAANASGVSPFRLASSSAIHGRNSSGARRGNVSSRLAMSPFGSMAMAGTPSIAASSSSDRQSPVLPLPVMPRQTAWVTRSRESYRTSASGPPAVFEVVLPAEVEETRAFRSPARRRHSISPEALSLEFEGTAATR